MLINAPRFEMLSDDRFPLNHLLTIFCQFSQQIRISLTGVSTNNVNEFVAPSAFFIPASGDIQCSSYIYIDWAILNRILVKKISVQVVSLKSNQQHVIRNIFQKEHSSRSVSVYVHLHLATGVEWLEFTWTNVALREAHVSVLLQRK